MNNLVKVKETGIRLKEITKSKCFSVKDITEYLNLDCTQSVYRWYNGYALPTVDHLYMLSQLFDVPMESMIVVDREKAEYNAKKI